MGKIKRKLQKMYETGALHITVGTFATKFVAFFGSIFVVRLLTKNDYGLLGYVENLYSYAFVFAGFGLSNGLLRYLVINEDNREKKNIHDYILKRSLFIDICIAIVVCIIPFIFKIPENYSTAIYLIPIVALLLPFQDILNEELYSIRAFFKNKLYAYLAFGSSVLLIIGRIVGAIICGTSGVLWSRVIINAAFTLLLILFVTKKLFPTDPVKPIEKEKKKEINAYSFQYMITNGFWALFMLNDTFLLGTLMNDPVALADYKVAYVLPGNISIFATAIGVFVGPLFTKNEKDNEWVKRNFKKVYGLGVLVVAGATAIIAVFAKPLISLMFGEQYLNVVGLMRVLLLAAFFNSGLRYTTANILAAMGEIKYNMIISGIGIVVQIVLDLLFIPRFGAMAVALSNCVVFLLMALALLYTFYKKYYMSKANAKA